MQFPYRIKVLFGKNTKKLKVIQYINRFMVHDRKGEYSKWNINKHDEFMGIELAFAEKTDAVLFRLGFQSDNEKIICENFNSGTQKEERV